MNIQIINADTAGVQYREINGRLQVWVEPYKTAQPRYCGAASGRTYIYNRQGQPQGYIAK